MDFHSSQLAKFQELRRNSRRLSNVSNNPLPVQPPQDDGESSRDKGSSSTPFGPGSSSALAGPRLQIPTGLNFQAPTCVDSSDDSQVIPLFKVPDHALAGRESFMSNVDVDNLEIRNIGPARSSAISFGTHASNASNLQLPIKRDFGPSASQSSKASNQSIKVSAGKVESQDGGKVGKRSATLVDMDDGEKSTNFRGGSTRDFGAGKGALDKKGTGKLESALLDAATKEFMEYNTPGLGGHEACGEKGVLHPDSQMRGYLQLFCCFFTYYMGIIIPLQMSFWVHAGESLSQFWINSVLDSLFFVDVLLNFVTAYRPGFEELADASEEEVNLFLVTDRRRIMWHAAKHFRFDAIGTIPMLDVWGLLIHFGSMPAGKLEPEHLRVLLPWRFFRLLTRLWRTYQFKRIGLVTMLWKRLWDRIERSIGLSSAMFTLFILLVPIHWVTCAFYASSSCDFTTESCFFKDEVQFVSKDPVQCGLSGRECWKRSYGVSLFRILTLFNGEGHPMREHTSLFELMICIASTLAGAVVLGLVFGEVATALAQHNAEKKEHIRQVSALGKHLKELHIEEGLRKKILEYRDCRFEMYRHRNNAEHMLKDLNDSLSGTLVLYLHSEVISEFPLLADLVSGSRHIAVRVVALLVMRTYLSGDVVCTKNAPADRLGILLFGTVIESARSSGMTPSGFRPYYEGPDILFAKALLLERCAFAFSCVASDVCEMYELSNAAYQSLRNEYSFACSHQEALEYFEIDVSRFDEGQHSHFPGSDIIREDEIDLQAQNLDSFAAESSEANAGMTNAIFNSVAQSAQKRSNYMRSKTKQGNKVEGALSIDDGHPSDSDDSNDSDENDDDEDSDENDDDDDSEDSGENKNASSTASKERRQSDTGSKDAPPPPYPSVARTATDDALPHSSATDDGEDEVPLKPSNSVPSGSQDPEIEDDEEPEIDDVAAAPSRSSAADRPSVGSENQMMVGKSKTDRTSSGRGNRGSLLTTPNRKRGSTSSARGSIAGSSARGSRIRLSFGELSAQLPQKENINPEKKKSVTGAFGFLKSLVVGDNTKEEHKREEAERKVQEMAAHRLELKRQIMYGEEDQGAKARRSLVEVDDVKRRSVTAQQPEGVKRHSVKEQRRSIKEIRRSLADTGDAKRRSVAALAEIEGGKRHSVKNQRRSLGPQLKNPEVKRASINSFVSSRDSDDIYSDDSKKEEEVEETRKSVPDRGPSIKTADSGLPAPAVHSAMKGTRASFNPGAGLPSTQGQGAHPAHVMFRQSSQESQEEEDLKEKQRQEAIGKLEAAIQNVQFLLQRVRAVAGESNACDSVDAEGLVEPTEPVPIPIQ